jgi:hypothetical protein
MFGTSTRSGFRRGCGPASWRPPSDLVDQVHVSGALSGARTGKGPRWQTHAERRNLGISVRPGHPAPAATLSSTCSVLPRDRVSVEVAAQQVGAHSQTLLTRSTFPVHYPVLAPERGPRWQTHAERRNLGISVRPGHPAPAATLPAIPEAAPFGGSRLSLVRSGSPGADAVRL